ncbi:unnamed protein product [Mucor fragilis]
MSQTQLTINKTSAIQEEEREIQQMDQEIQIMKEKVVKMKALNGLELELATLALLRQQYRSVRLKTEKKMNELYHKDSKLSDSKSVDTDINSDSDNSSDSGPDFR